MLFQIDFVLYVDPRSNKCLSPPKDERIFNQSTIKWDTTIWNIQKFFSFVIVSHSQSGSPPAEQVLLLPERHECLAWCWTATTETFGALRISRIADQLQRLVHFRAEHERTNQNVQQNQLFKKCFANKLVVENRNENINDLFLNRNLCFIQHKNRYRPWFFWGRNERVVHESYKHISLFPSNSIYNYFHFIFCGSGSIKHSRQFFTCKWLINARYQMFHFKPRHRSRYPSKFLFQ